MADLSLESRPAVPTTRVLAIGTFPQTPPPDEFKKVMSQEIPATLRLYLDGKIDQMFVRQDKLGVVFLMNFTEVADAHAALERLPLGVAKMMSFELIPLGPLSPLGTLLGAKNE